MAPIYEEGAVRRDVYLPSGNWVRVNSGQMRCPPESIPGGRTLSAHAELSEFIAFVREGSEVLSCFLESSV